MCVHACVYIITYVRYTLLIFPYSHSFCIMKLLLAFIIIYSNQPVVESVVGAEFVVGAEVVVSFWKGRGIVALGLTKVGYSISKGSDGPKHISSLRSGKLSQFNISDHSYWNSLNTPMQPSYTWLHKFRHGLRTTEVFSGLQHPQNDA